MNRQNSENDRLLCGRADRVNFLLALLIASLVTGMVSRQLRVQAEKETQEHLAQEVLRFHILANSDSDEDQALKMTVKEEVLGYLEGAMPEDMDVAETTDWMRRHTDELENLSREIVQ